MKNAVQLITYVDRLAGGGLADLDQLLRSNLSGLFGGIHLLPFFQPIDGADAGFDPIDHRVVDPRLGSWDDIRRLARTVPVMADLIVNHISSRSPEFLDFTANGQQSSYADLFLTLDKVFPNGATDEDLRRIYRPRPSPPLTSMALANGETRLVWTTFTADQVDIDVCSPSGRSYWQRILEVFAESGVTMIRLDAAGYAIKKAGTSCFMLPETYDFIGELSARARERGIEVLVEVHSHYQDQIDLARRADRVYDFVLPPLVLHALHTRDATPLKDWLTISPRNCVTVLDAHDGIGVRDVGADPRASTSRPGLLSPSAINDLVEAIHTHSRGESRLATGSAASNLDVYQVNCTYYDALGRDDRAYLLARAMQFFAPGIPQVYYVGLLAGGNDVDLLERTGVGRDINRHYYTREEVEAALATPVVRQLCSLIRLRNEHPAFNGAFSVGDTRPDHVRMEWRKGPHAVALEVDLSTCSALIKSTGIHIPQTWHTDAIPVTMPLTST